MWAISAELERAGGRARVAVAARRSPCYAGPRTQRVRARGPREIAMHAQPTKPGSDEGGAAGEHGGMALPGHGAVNKRTCRRATVAYGLLMLQKQYSSMSPEARKCSLSTMWL